MKVHVFEISYYIQGPGEEPSTGPVLVQAPALVAAADEAAAVALLKHQVEDELGVVMTVTHISNGAQDVMVADPVVVDESSELASLKESLAAMTEENAKLLAALNQKPSEQPEQPFNDPKNPDSELVIDGDPPHAAVTVGELKARKADLTYGNS